MYVYSSCRSNDRHMLVYPNNNARETFDKDHTESDHIHVLT